jgi:hypothetical protein
MKQQLKNITTIDTPALDVTVGQVLAEVDGEYLHRGFLRRWYCRRRNRRLVNGYPVVTDKYAVDGEGGEPTVCVESSEMPGLTWCLDPGEIVKVVAP